MPPSTVMDGRVPALRVLVRHAPGRGCPGRAGAWRAAEGQGAPETCPTRRDGPLAGPAPAAPPPAQSHPRTRLQAC